MLFFKDESLANTSTQTGFYNTPLTDWCLSGHVWVIYMIAVASVSWCLSIWRQQIEHQGTFVKLQFWRASATARLMSEASEFVDRRSAKVLNAAWCLRLLILSNPGQKSPRGQKQSPPPNDSHLTETGERSHGDFLSMKGNRFVFGDLFSGRLYVRLLDRITTKTDTLV